MASMQHKTVLALVIVTCMVTAALAETKKEFRFTVGPNSNISVDNQYGGISVKPGSSNQVIITATQRSDKTEVDNAQRGNRIEIASHLLPGADQYNGRVDYELLIPSDATVNLRSSTGPLYADSLQGDLTLEGADAVVDVHNVNNGHVHVRTMGGPITLTDIRNGHVEISSISGAVTMKSVSGPMVQANSGSGKILYDGDFGGDGDYKLTTHTGDIEALVPANVSADFSVHSMTGKVQKDLPLEPGHSRYSFEEGRAFFGTVGKAASKVVLHSFSGRIRLKQR